MSAAVLASGESAAAASAKTPRAAGVALLEAVSFERPDAAEASGELLLQFRVVGVIEEPPGGLPVRPGATISKKIRGDRRGIRPASEALSRKHVYLARIYWDNGSLAVGLRTAIGIRVTDMTKEPQRIAEYESKAFRRDVLKLRSAPTLPAEAAALAKLAESTPSPSGALCMEVEELCWKETAPWAVPLHEDRVERQPRLPEKSDIPPRRFNDTDRANLYEGMTTLAVRADAPDYVRHRALRFLYRLPEPVDRAKREETIARAVARLLDAYRDCVQDEERDLVYADSVEGILANFLENEPWLRSAPQLAERFTRLPKDIEVHKQRLLKKAGPDLDETGREVIGETGRRLLEALSEDPRRKR